MTNLFKHLRRKIKTMTDLEVRITATLTYKNARILWEQRLVKEKEEVE
jgi:hypothetical protein